MDRTLSKGQDGEITQAEVDAAIEKYYRLVLDLTKSSDKNGGSFARENDDDYLTMQFPPDESNPIDNIREGKPIRIKTVFHSAEFENLDPNGGSFIGKYYVRKSVEKLSEFLRTAFPNYSKEQLSRLAIKSGKDYQDVKDEVIWGIAENIVQGRLAIGRFLHDEIKATVDIILKDLIFDAEMYVMSLHGYEIAEQNIFKKLPNSYEKRRKERVRVLRKRGRPSRPAYDESEFNQMVENIEKAVNQLKKSGKRVTKHGGARQIFERHSNPLQQLNRFLEKYEVDFSSFL